MSTKTNKCHEVSINKMWQRNLSTARNIRMNLNSIFNNSYNVIQDILNSSVIYNDTDPIGLLISLTVCIGHFAGNSTVNITNHSSNLNLFLLLIGPSGCGKSKIIAPIKKSVMNAIKALKLTKDQAGMLDDFTTASLSARLAKSNVFVIADEAEKPLLEIGFYSPGSEISATDRIAGCKFFGTIPTTKDTMTYHLEITSHLSFVGATTGRLWPRLLSYYAQSHQSDGFSERFLHYAMPKRTNVVVNFQQSIDYENEEDSDQDEDLNDEDMITENEEGRNYFSSNLAQILIISYLLGKRQFRLSRHGTKKFLNKVRQMQELSQVDQIGDINYGSRMGKGAEILCKLSALAQLLKISGEILLSLQNLDHLSKYQIDSHFIRAANLLIEELYPTTESIIEIEAKSCRFAGQLMCSYLMKMLFSFYNTEPVSEEQFEISMKPQSDVSNSKIIRERVLHQNQLFFLKGDLTGPMGLVRHHSSEAVNIVLHELINHELIRQGPFISSTSRGTVHMKSIPTAAILTDPLKRAFIEKTLQEINLNLTEYTEIITNRSIVLPKQKLTNQGLFILNQPEYRPLFQNLWQKYRSFFSKVEINIVEHPLIIEQNFNSNNTTIQHSHINQDVIEDENSDSDNNMQENSISSIHSSNLTVNSSIEHESMETTIDMTTSARNSSQNDIVVSNQSTDSNLSFQASNISRSSDGISASSTSMSTTNSCLSSMKVMQHRKTSRSNRQKGTSFKKKSIRKALSMSIIQHNNTLIPKSKSSHNILLSSSSLFLPTVPLMVDSEYVHEKARTTARYRIMDEIQSKADATEPIYRIDTNEN